jgi:phosphoglycerol transferase MdoB-like AlkP superfamily enzyme
MALSVCSHKPHAVYRDCHGINRISFGVDELFCLELTEDYLPFIHSLQENTVWGRMYVSVEGGNTANSEFEFLTSNTMRFLPYHSVAYSQHIKGEMPSIAQQLKQQGYVGINAYHPYKRSGWNRSTVYPLLGFQNFYDIDYFKENGNDACIRKFISDEFFGTLFGTKVNQLSEKQMADHYSTPYIIWTNYDI